MRSLVLVIAVSLLGCTQDESCEEQYPNGYPGDDWHPPRHVMYTATEADTLVCHHVEFDEVCSAGDGCYCLFPQDVNRVTTTVACADECTSYGEVACTKREGCFIARNASTNEFIGCYETLDWPTSAACSVHIDGFGCATDPNCAGLYMSTGTDTWQFVSCTDE